MTVSIHTEPEMNTIMIAVAITPVAVPEDGHGNEEKPLVPHASTSTALIPAIVQGNLRKSNHHHVIVSELRV